VAIRFISSRVASDAYRVGLSKSLMLVVLSVAFISGACDRSDDHERRITATTTTSQPERSEPAVPLIKYSPEAFALLGLIARQPPPAILRTDSLQLDPNELEDAWLSHLSDRVLADNPRAMPIVRLCADGTGQWLGHGDPYGLIAAGALITWWVDPAAIALGPDASLAELPNSVLLQIRDVSYNAPIHNYKLSAGNSDDHDIAYLVVSEVESATTCRS